MHWHLSCTGICHVRAVVMWGQLSCEGICHALTFVMHWHFVLYGHLSCMGICPALAFVLHGYLSCTGICHVRAFVMYGHLSCTGICHVLAFVMYGHLSCADICHALTCSGGRADEEVLVGPVSRVAHDRLDPIQAFRALKEDSGKTVWIFSFVFVAILSVHRLQSKAWKWTWAGQIWPFVLCREWHITLRMMWIALGPHFDLTMFILF
jgi:hypothetical protein